MKSDVMARTDDGLMLSRRVNLENCIVTWLETIELKKVRIIVRLFQFSPCNSLERRFTSTSIFLFLSQFNNVSLRDNLYGVYCQISLCTISDKKQIPSFAMLSYCLFHCLLLDSPLVTI